MSLCPVCGKVYCDHTAEERNQTPKEMMRPLTLEELKAWEDHPDSSGYVPEKMAAARKYQHHVFTKKDKREVEAHLKERAKQEKLRQERK